MGKPIDAAADAGPTQHLGLSAASANDLLSKFLSQYEATYGPLPFSQQLVSEALFALAEIGPDISGDDRCLEIGAGTGLLTHLLASAGVRIDALEPIGSGFSEFRGPLAAVADQHGDRVRILDARIEDFTSENCFDVAFSINVFEHVDDWRAALLRTVSALQPNGRAIILCPNYDVPYEPHFGIPIVGSKAMTFRLFRSRIARHETQRQGEGLWKSLNFISGSEVRRFCEAEGIPCSFDSGVVPRMFKRVAGDPDFRTRRGALAPLLLAAERIGLPSLIEKLPLRMHPYLRITLTRPSDFDVPSP